MGTPQSRDSSRGPHHGQGSHECEILGGGLEAAESLFLWENCEKNPGHKNFVPVSDLTEKHTRNSLSTKQRQMLRKFTDRVVRLRVQWTSTDRPEEDELHEYRGTDRLRMGTGFITHRLSGPKSNEPCPCRECHGGRASRSYWAFTVRTACHVVYNTEEARQTRVDLFYDDENCQRDGRMKTVWAVEVEEADPTSDECLILCVTHDEALVERVSAPKSCWAPSRDYSPKYYQGRRGLIEWIREASTRTVYDKAVVISHPHGQPKKISMGKSILCKDSPVSTTGFKYQTATCPGSSGAPVLLTHSDFFNTSFFPWSGPVHGGTHNKTPTNMREQVNYSKSPKHFY